MELGRRFLPDPSSLPASSSRRHPASSRWCFRHCTSQVCRGRTVGRDPRPLVWGGSSVVARANVSRTHLRPKQHSSKQSRVSISAKKSPESSFSYIHSCTVDTASNRHIALVFTATTKTVVWLTLTTRGRHCEVDTLYAWSVYEQSYTVAHASGLNIDGVMWRILDIFQVNKSSWPHVSLVSYTSWRRLWLCDVACLHRAHLATHTARRPQYDVSTRQPPFTCNPCSINCRIIQAIRPLTRVNYSSTRPLACLVV